MKKVLIVSLMAFIVIMFYSCKPNPEKIVKNNIKEYVKKHFNDPESYEFISLTPFDTVLYKENIEFRVEYYKHGIEFDKSQIEHSESMIELEKEYIDLWPADSDYRIESINKYTNDIKEYSKEIQMYENIIYAIDSLKEVMGEKINNVASYTFILKCRANNAIGAKTLNSFYIQTTPEYEILNFTEEEKKVYLAPNGFPGYDEIINKYEK